MPLGEGKKEKRKEVRERGRNTGRREGGRKEKREGGKKGERGGGREGGREGRSENESHRFQFLQFLYCARTNEWISPQFAFFLQPWSGMSLFVCTDFRIKLVCIFLVSFSSWIWFQSKQLSFPLNSLLFGGSSFIPVIIQVLLYFWRCYLCTVLNCI